MLITLSHKKEYFQKLLLFGRFDHDLFHDLSPVTEDYCYEVHTPYRVLEIDFCNCLGVAVSLFKDLLSNYVCDLYGNNIFFAFYVKKIFPNWDRVNCNLAGSIGSQCFLLDGILSNINSILLSLKG